MLLVRVPDLEARVRGAQSDATNDRQAHRRAGIRCSPNCLRLTVGTPEEKSRARSRALQSKSRLEHGPAQQRQPGGCR